MSNKICLATALYGECVEHCIFNSATGKKYNKSKHTYNIKTIADDGPWTIHNKTPHGNVSVDITLVYLLFGRRTLTLILDNLRLF